MINKEIIINKKTREIINGENGDLFRLGVDGENLQENIIFKFDDEFVNGTARIEITMQDNTKSYVMINKVNETYVLPVKSILTKTGLNKMQLVITQGTDNEEIPIFKSKMFSFYIADSINADTEQPEEYPQWIDKANTTLNEIDNFDIDAIKELNEATITITDRYGETKSVQVYDGENGQDAKINGVNTLRLLAGKNISLEQEDDELTISAEGGSGGGAVNSVNGMTGDVIIEIPDVSDFITKDVDNLTNYEPKATTGNNLVASIDSSTYVMTLTLRNSSNETLNSQTIDLPLETMVVNGSYDDTTKKIILTLKNGNTIEFSVADLISGLQSEITSSNKLNADLIDDNTSINQMYYLGYMTELNTNNGLDLRKARKGIYFPDRRGGYSSYINNLDNNSLSNISYCIHLIFVFKQISNIETPESKTYFAYALANPNDTGQTYILKFYVGTSRQISYDIDYYSSLKLITEGTQEIKGKKIYWTIPEQLTTNAPTLDAQFTNKKYVDDQISANTPNMGQYIIDKNDTDEPFVFEGKKAGIYTFNKLYDSSYFFYKINNSDSSYVSRNIGQILQLCLYNDFDYESAETNEKFGYIYAKNVNSGTISRYYIQKDTSFVSNYGSTYYQVLTSNSQSISGIKTFFDIPQQYNTTAPTLATQFTNKKYVDDSLTNKFWIGTQAEYDAITTKDENVLYFIQEV